VLLAAQAAGTNIQVIKDLNLKSGDISLRKGAIPFSCRKAARRGLPGSIRIALRPVAQERKEHTYEVRNGDCPCVHRPPLARTSAGSAHLEPPRPQGHDTSRGPASSSIPPRREISSALRINPWRHSGRHGRYGRVFCDFYDTVTVGLRENALSHILCDGLMRYETFFCSAPLSADDRTQSWPC